MFCYAAEGTTCIVCERPADYAHVREKNIARYCKRCFRKMVDVVGREPEIKTITESWPPANPGGTP